MHSTDCTVVGARHLVSLHLRLQVVFSPAGEYGGGRAGSNIERCRATGADRGKKRRAETTVWYRVQCSHFHFLVRPECGPLAHCHWPLSGPMCESRGWPTKHILCSRQHCRSSSLSLRRSSCPTCASGSESSRPLSRLGRLRLSPTRGVWYCQVSSCARRHAALAVMAQTPPGRGGDDGDAPPAAPALPVPSVSKHQHRRRHRASRIAVGQANYIIRGHAELGLLGCLAEHSSRASLSPRARSLGRHDASARNARPQHCPRATPKLESPGPCAPRPRWLLALNRAEAVRRCRHRRHLLCASPPRPP